MDKARPHWPFIVGVVALVVMLNAGNIVLADSRLWTGAMILIDAMCVTVFLIWAGYRIRRSWPPKDDAE